MPVSSTTIALPPDWRDLRSVRRQIAVERVRHAIEQPRTGGPGQGGEQNALRHEHTQKANTWSSEREADGDFAAA